MAVLHHDGAIAFANTSLQDALGLSLRHLQGKAFTALLVDSAMCQTALLAAQEKGFTALRFESSLRRSGRAPLAVHIHVSCLDAGGSGAGQVLLELWPQQQHARQDREERLRQQAQAHHELIRNLAHEIKNPLGGMRGAAQLLAMELDNPELGEYTQVIIHEVDRLQSLVDRLLAPHRHPHRVSDVNIHEICERVAAVVLTQHPQGLAILRDYDTSIPEFRGDREQLIQVVLNIVDNAAHALQPRIAAGDGQIVLRTRIARQITLGRERYKLALQLHVIDNGPGIPETIRDRIFYPLVSGRDGGSGLGLSLAQTFVQRHHGLIECDSELGRTEFRILIPLP